MMRISIFFLLMLSSVHSDAQRYILLSSVNRAASQQAETGPDTILWGGLGQSNWQGEGVARPSVDSNLNPRLLQLSRGMHGQPTGTIYRLDNPVQLNGVVNKVGIHLWVAKKVFLATSKPSIMWGVAQGGTAIASFLPGHASGFYTEFRNQYNTYLRPSKRLGSEWQFFVWHQGETDNSSAPNSPSLYPPKFGTLIDSIRLLSDNPLLPVFLGGLTPHYGTYGVASAIQDTLRRLPQRYSNVYYVPACGCNEVEDAFHFQSTSYEIFGNRYGDLINHVVYDYDSAPEKPHFNVLYSSATSASLRVNYVYSPLSITSCEVYVGGSLAATVTPSQDVNTCAGIVVPLSGITISGQPVYVRVRNSVGWTHSDTITTVYSATLPTPTNSWLLNETTGTTISATHGGVNGTLNVDASTVASTMTTTGEACFNFSGTQKVTLSTPVSLQDTATVAFECDPGGTTGLLKSILGDEATEKYIMPSIEATKVGMFTGDQDRISVSPDMRLYHKVAIIFNGYRVYVYVDGAFVAEDATSHPTANLLIRELGSGHSSFRFEGKFNKIRIWNGTALHPGHVAQL